MSGPPPGAVWLPAAGPVHVPCTGCRAVALAVEHREVWGVLDQVPHDAPVVGEGCPRCRSTAEPRRSSRLVYAGPARVAGVMPKVAARECAWLECVTCGHDGPLHYWAWVVCSQCGRESRGRV